MKTIIILPLPFDQWETFHPFINRFCDTFKKFPPKSDYEIFAMCCEPDKAPQYFFPNDWLKDINFRYIKYEGRGCDIGSAQYAASLVNRMSPDDFIIAMTSRCYFHREGWLERYVEAFEKDPDGLYGATTSWEGGKAHICTRAYAMRAGLFSEYPHVIDTREKGQKFEVGEWCITDWFYEKKRKCYQVTWDGIQEQQEWRTPENIFRKGDQSNCIIHDKHTDAYRDADETEKRRLETILLG